MDQKYSYLVGGLISDKLTPEIEQKKLNQCGEAGWKLVNVLIKKYRGHDYTVFYFRRPFSDQWPSNAPRFDVQFLAD